MDMLTILENFEIKAIEISIKTNFFQECIKVKQNKVILSRQRNFNFFIIDQ